MKIIENIKNHFSTVKKLKGLCELVVELKKKLEIEEVKDVKDKYGWIRYGHSEYVKDEKYYAIEERCHTHMEERWKLDDINKKLTLELSDTNSQIAEINKELVNKTLDLNKKDEELEKIRISKQETEEALNKTKSALEEALKRESELRKDLIETMKLNNQLNCRSVETKTVSSEPINL